METPPDLSPSEKRTLQKAAEGEFQVAEFDWVALQRLKALGFVEERSTAVVITAEGRRVSPSVLAGLSACERDTLRASDT
jgi:ribosomal protein S19E (S16A)